MRSLRGVIVSDKMHKTVRVRVERLKQHPKYQKYYRLTKHFKAHDEKGEYRMGDTVLIQETRPLSREKRWRVVALVKRSEAASDIPDSEIPRSGSTNQESGESTAASS